MSELKLCPCCGSGDASIKVMTVGTFRVFCESCRLCIPGCQTREEAIEAWNTRAPQSQWISVANELPKISGPYWTFSGDDANESVIQQRVHMYDSDYRQFNSHTVTHWMQLPEPPQ